MSEVKVTNVNFEDEVLKSELPVLVDFWAPWCGPCKMLGPVVAQIADEYDGKIKVCKINVDEEEALAMQYKVMSIPTIMVFKDGVLANKTVGYQEKDAILDLIFGV